MISFRNAFLASSICDYDSQQSSVCRAKKSAVQIFVKQEHKVNLVQLKQSSCWVLKFINTKKSKQCR